MEFIKKTVTVVACLIIHVVAISVTGITLFFSNDPIVLTFMVFLVFLVFIQTLLFGCIINKLEQNATMEPLIDMTRYLFKIKSSKKHLLDDIPIIFVGLTLTALSAKLFIVLLLGSSEENIKLFERATRYFLFFQFGESLMLFKNLFYRIVG